MTIFDSSKLRAAILGFNFGVGANGSSTADPRGDGPLGGLAGTVIVTTPRFFVAIALAVALGACAAAPPTMSPIHKGRIAAKQAALRAQLDWNRRCEIMVLASNEPEKAFHMASRCRNGW